MSKKNKISEIILRIEYCLSNELNQINFGLPVEYVYNPLDYAKDCHVNFVEKYFDGSNGKILFLGMNPGPWGMCQNGIPFGEKSAVKDWFSSSGRIEKPMREHEKVRIQGFDCARNEVSGKRFWGLMRKIFEIPENFFENCLIYNYCPLAFLNKSGTNVTPTEIKGKKTDLYKLCDKALADIINEIGIEIVIGIGRFAHDRVKQTLKQHDIKDVKVHYMPHPSARAGLNEESWNREAEEVLKIVGLERKKEN